MRTTSFFSGSALGLSAIAALLLACSCGDSEPAARAQGGAGGSAAGTGGRAGESMGGGAGKGGGAAAGSGGGAVAGSSSSGGAPEAGAGAGAGGEGGVPPGGPYQAVLGEVCPLATTIGVVQLSGFPEPYVQVTLWDGVNPWIGEAELSTPTCAYHHYTAGGCPTCAGGETCSIAGECVPERRTIKDATLLVSTAGMEREYTADPQLGGIYSMLDIGTATSSYGMTLKWGDTEVVLEPMGVASGEFTDLEVKTEGDSSQPGALDATWTPSSDGAFVRSTIPINHHAGGPTFTQCGAPESAGSFHADAAMIDPLSVVTGLEFQGVEHVFVAAAQTPAGCVEYRFGEQLYVLPN